MIRVVQAARTRDLLDALAEDVAQARAQRGPFEPVALAVPGTAVEAHVRQGLALRLGIAAHIDARSLRAHLSEVLTRNVPGLEIASPSAITAAVLELLHRDPVLDDPDLEPLRSYLEAADRPNRDVRRVELAEMLGPIFYGYASDRPEWISAVRDGALASAGDAGHERIASDWAFLTDEGPLGGRWQAALLRRLVADDGPLAPVLPCRDHLKRRWLLLDAVSASEAWASSSSLFIFAVPVTSAVMARALARVAEHGEVFLYAPTPCLEFWEDLPAGRSGRTPSSQLSLFGGGSGAPPADDPPLLRLWGRAGREEARRLASLTDGDVDVVRRAEPKPRTLLDAVRNDVHRRAPARRLAPTPAARAESVPDRLPPAAPADESLVLLEAPGIRRECEAIAREIRERVEGDPDLRWSDVVVALATPEADLYRSQLSAAFADAGDIPHHALELSLASDSRVIDAVRLLLALPQSGFNRQDLLRILTHPTVRDRFGIGEADEWIEWCERLVIVHGADRSDHEGTYIEKDVFHWDQGLRRLALGAFVAAWGLGRDAPLMLGGRLVAPVDFAVHERESAGRLIALTRSLIADARATAAARHDLPSWARYVRILVDTYIGAPTEDDERDLYRVLAAIDDLERIFDGPSLVAFQTAARLLVRRLDRLRTHRGPPLAEAVVIAPLHEVASLPFRLTFIPGLGEGRFPAPERTTSLDLRAHQGSGHDVSPRMRDQYALLLRILATEDAVQLSYVARNPETGDPLAPSASLVELIDVLESGYVGEGQMPTRREPLRRHVRPGRSLSARAEQGAVALREHLRSELPARTPFPSLDDLERVLPAPVFERLARRLRLHQPRERPVQSGQPRARVRLSSLRRFLEEPVQGWAIQVLGLSEGDLGTDPFARTDEAFEITAARSVELLRETFLEWLAAAEPGPALAERYRARADRLELEGQLPTGVFGDVARRKHLAILEGWRLGLVEALEGRPAPLRRLELGRPSPAAIPSVLLPALELDAGLLVGTTEPVLPEGGSFLLLERALGSTRSALREELKAWLTQLAVAASGRPSTDPWPIFVAHGGERLHRGQLCPIEGPKARALLEALVKDLLEGRHGYRLPLDTQLRLQSARERGASARRMKDILESGRPDPFGPLDALELPLPEVEEALDVVDRRLGPFLAMRRGDRE